MNQMMKNNKKAIKNRDINSSTYDLNILYIYKIEKIENKINECNKNIDKLKSREVFTNKLKKHYNKKLDRYDKKLKILYGNIDFGQRRKDQ